MKTEKDLRKVLRDIRKIDSVLTAQLLPQDIVKLKEKKNGLKKQAKDVLDEMLGGEE